MPADNCLLVKKRDRSPPCCQACCQPPQQKCGPNQAREEKRKRGLVHDLYLRPCLRDYGTSSLAAHELHTAGGGRREGGRGGRGGDDGGGGWEGDGQINKLHTVGESGGKRSVHLLKTRRGADTPFPSPPLPLPPLSPSHPHFEIIIPLLLPPLPSPPLSHAQLQDVCQL